MMTRVPLPWKTDINNDSNLNQSVEPVLCLKFYECENQVDYDKRQMIPIRVLVLCHSTSKSIDTRIQHQSLWLWSWSRAFYHQREGPASPPYYRPRFHLVAGIEHAIST
jgi:hypothetical protein